MKQEDKGQHAFLRIRSGPLAGQSYPLDRANIVIGREKGCNIRPDGYSEVSRRNTRIFWDQGFWIEDLGSRNGTKIGGVPLTGRHRLQADDIIEMGDFSVQFLLPVNVVLLPPAQVGNRESMPRRNGLPVPAIAAVVIAVVALGIFGSVNGAGKRVHQEKPHESQSGIDTRQPDGKSPQDPSPTPASGGELEASVLQQTKDSTVLIEARDPESGEGKLGSGFCTIAPNLIATNAHMVLASLNNPKPYALTVVLHSGLRGQKELPGTLLGYSTRYDLAFVGIDGENSLHPISSGDPAALKETEVCWAFGFPGVRPTNSGRPEVSVQRVEVQALRNDDAGVLDRVQLGGSVTHGNSGGPIVSAQGHVVAVVCELARRPDDPPTQAPGISYAIPMTRLEALWTAIKKAEQGEADSRPNSESRR